YGAALCVTWAKAPMLVALAAAPLAAAVCAALYGYFCVRLSSIYFAMLTLAFAQIAFAIVHQWYDVTGGDNGLLGIWPAPWLAGPLAYYYLALASCGGGIALLALVERAPFGLTLRAARDHAPRAETVGINIRLHQWLAFIVAGFFGGLAGGTFVFLKGSVFPDYLAVPMSVEPLVMVLLGGVQALAGQLRADGGAVAYRGEQILGLAPYVIWRRGVSRTFQITATFATLSALENVRVARLSHTGDSRMLRRPADGLEVERSLALLEQVGLADQAVRPAGVLAYGDLKKLELAIALANDPELLLLDEPTAGMAPAERGALMALTASIARERTLTVLFTEHDMDVVFAI